MWGEGGFGGDVAIGVEGVCGRGGRRRGRGRREAKRGECTDVIHVGRCGGSF